jgi:hypothetical protein
VVTKGFKPLVVGGTKVENPSTPPDPTMPKHQEALLKLLDVMRESVELGQATGIVAIVILKDGSQSENAITEGNSYELMGRINALAGNVNLKTYSVEEEQEALEDLDLDD